MKCSYIKIFWEAVYPAANTLDGQPPMFFWLRDNYFMAPTLERKDKLNYLWDSKAKYFGNQ